MHYKTKKEMLQIDKKLSPFTDKIDLYYLY